MKLNKVHGGSEDHGPGHLLPGQAQHSWTQHTVHPLLFLPSREGLK